MTAAMPRPLKHGGGSSKSTPMKYNPTPLKDPAPCGGCGQTTNGAIKGEPKCFSCHMGPWERPAGYDHTPLSSGADLSRPEGKNRVHFAPFYKQDRATILADVMAWDEKRRELGNDPASEKEKQNMRSRIQFLGITLPKFKPTRLHAHGIRLKK
jgi:hypothetical protein